MGLIVQKFGGSSVANAEKIHLAAKRAIAAKQQANQVVVVVSAMGDTTDDLIQLAKQVCPNPPKREMDQLLATGEQVTIALMAMAIHAQGQEAISFTGGQIGLITDNSFTKARIQSINKQRIFEQLAKGRIVIVAGFQGVTPEGDYTTLGRGGSNATLVDIGASLKADVCENYTDVDGIFTADPRIVPTARKIDRISYDEMLELSGLGARLGPSLRLPTSMDLHGLLTASPHLHPPPQYQGRRKKTAARNFGHTPRNPPPPLIQQPLLDLADRRRRQIH